MDYDNVQVWLFQVLHELCMVFTVSLSHCGTGHVVAKNGLQEPSTKACGLVDVVGMDAFSFKLDDTPTPAQQVAPWLIIIRGETEVGSSQRGLGRRMHLWQQLVPQRVSHVNDQVGK